MQPHPAETEPPGADEPGKAVAPVLQGDAAIAALRASGAQQMDPVRFRYLEALARRAATRDGALRQALDAKLGSALAAYRSQHARQREALQADVSARVHQHPEAAAPLQRLFAEGDWPALRRLMDQLDAPARGGLLAALLATLDGRNALQTSPVADAAASVQPMAAGAADELKTLRDFRDTWTRLRVDRQLSRSQDKAPENPGPLNSHLLVLRALRRMQDISPAYLERFVGHVEALMWLDQAGVRSAAQPAKPGRAAAGSKARPARSRKGG
jgi:hypothetical protein